MNEKIEAWNKFALSGLVEDYLEFRRIETAQAVSEAQNNENEHRRAGAQGDGYRRK